MTHTKFDTEHWARKEHFEVFKSFGQCTFSMTVELDITTLLQTIKRHEYKFYPTLIHQIAGVMNQFPEFKMAIKNDELIVWDKVNPSYTIFHEAQETFSSIWSEYQEEYADFVREYSADQDKYGQNLAYFPKAEFIENVFYISAVPWASFTSFNLNFANIDNFFAPLCTVGQFFERDDKTLLPIALQVHHATSDGFHAARFFNTLQAAVNRFDG
ncbi:MAG: type A chloramphenicol O-acetyltransferase [Neisseriaceae bacterium]|nr:type A chloramphenicol O-acetyltransferase [Neisseriaceae bacterium]MBP6861412.1 type A chloramphenicol O-acetyltransferase [Neisseriaceae bacterium]